MFYSIGSNVILATRHTVNIFKLFGQIIYWMCVGPFKKKVAGRESVFYQLVFVGIKSILIVFFVTLFTGIVLAMQSAYQLEQFGATIYVSSLVAISLCRELGPVLTALVVAGRVGAAFTAELGSMKVTEQIEALETMALNPIWFLVVPRFLALFIMLPCLTILGNFAGMFGGYLIGVLNLRLNSALYIDTTIEYLKLKDVYTGLFKSVVFGMIIALIGCYMGLNTKGGAVGVGKSTTVSVVASFICIILADCILTGIFFFSKM
jgi:phospholipid/cholesterol/gamma-HCH transport system permease protein